MTEISLPNNLPAGVAADELYDGPTPDENVVPIKRQLFTGPAELVKPIPPPSDAGVDYHRQMSSAAELKKSYPAVLEAALDVLSARLLGLLALLAACGVWALAVWEPSNMRTVAASLFSVLVLGPIVALYWKAG